MPSAHLISSGATAGDEEIVQRPAIRFQILVALPGHRRDDTRDKLPLANGVQMRVSLSSIEDITRLVQDLSRLGR